MNLNRARMIPRSIWPLSVEQFADQWNDWKEANDLLDFTDFIEQALDCVKEAPNSPDILFVDEAQDMDALEMALVRKWATAAGKDWSPWAIQTRPCTSGAALTRWCSTNPPSPRTTSACCPDPTGSLVMCGLRRWDG